MNSDLAAKYAELCQKLGDLKYKQSQTELLIQQTEKELYSLNYVASLSPKESKNDQ